jgi:hypothetical protein
MSDTESIRSSYTIEVDPRVVVEQTGTHPLNRAFGAASPVSTEELAELIAGISNLDNPTVKGVLGGALGTIKHNKNEFERERSKLLRQIGTLKARVEHHEERYLEAPQGYEENLGRAPSFYIPQAPGVWALAKWVRQLPDGRVEGYTARDGPTDQPYAAEIYTTNYYDNDDPPEPLPNWFLAALMGGPTEFHTLREGVAGLDDWGSLAEVLRHRRYSEMLRQNQVQRDILEAQHASIQEGHAACEFRMEGAKLAKQVGEFRRLVSGADEEDPRHRAFRSRQNGRCGRGRPLV